MWNKNLLPQKGDQMTNYNLLKFAVYRAGFTFESLAKLIGIEKSTMSYKSSGKKDFKQTEIAAISDALDLSKEERDSIFFDKPVELCSSGGD